MARTRSVAVSGIDGILLEVQADASAGLPSFVVSGLPDTACAQAPLRIRAAAGNCGVALPGQRLLVNLSPADLPKQGSSFDLAIAVAAFAAGGTFAPEVVRDVVHLGELGLDGTVRSVRGVLPAVLAAAGAGLETVAVPVENAAEASLVEGITVVPVHHLRELIERYVAISKGRPVPEPPELPNPAVTSSSPVPEPDLADLAGQEQARRALEIAAAGGHHLAMIGPPGAGKTMLAERLPGVLPELNRAQALEVTAVHSVLGMLGPGTLIQRPPFVAPHHGSTMAALIGGGSGRVRPGAISRADHGVLFLDEAPEFRRDVLDALRQPMESGVVTIARADHVVRYPARFQLVLAANPCRCGMRHGQGRLCTCSPVVQRGYLAKLSGPLMDRVDLRLQVLPVTRAALQADRAESSAVVAQRVLVARERQRHRWAEAGWERNSQVSGAQLRSTAWRLPATHTRLLDQALDRGRMTLRGYDRVLRLAWTLADLGQRSAPGADELMQALILRGELTTAA